MVLEGLSEAPLEPLKSESERFLTLKKAFQLDLTSLKIVGYLQALSVASSCLSIFDPRLGYIPKVRSMTSQLVIIHVFFPLPHKSLLCRLHLLCPARRAYVYCSGQWRRSFQLLICYGSCNRSKSVSKQRHSHWI